jgi:hypothetical protein
MHSMALMFKMNLFNNIRNLKTDYIPIFDGFLKLVALDECLTAGTLIDYQKYIFNFISNL